MWSRILRVWPSCVVRPLSLVVRSTPLLKNHVCGDGVSGDRDIHNLQDQTEPPLSFTASEERLGEETLRSYGVPEGSRFVCLISRDQEYLKSIYRDLVEYHDYRNSDIDNFIDAVSALARRGLYVFRMGSVVLKQFKTEDPMIIDYATNGMRTDFMDIYLGAKCLFCITTSTGFDAVPQLFRKPLAVVNHAPIGDCKSWSKNNICRFKHHVRRQDRVEMSLREICDSSVVHAYASADYVMEGIDLVENSTTEIRDVVLEMLDKIDGISEHNLADDLLQEKFVKIMTSSQSVTVNDATALTMHGNILCRHGTTYLRNNPWFLN